jgi:hypothetical protein
MDPLLSNLFPANRLGYDGFEWWIGQVEGTASEEANNKGGYRAKVRIIGDHPDTKEELDTKDLPWATMMMPVNAPFMPGNIGGAHHQLVEGCWVIGFYLDNERQKPIIMGSIGQVPGSTTIVKNVRPEDPPFTTGVRSGKFAPIPQKDGLESPENREGGSGQTGTQTASGNLFTNPTFGVDTTGLQGPSQPFAQTGGGLSDGTKRGDGSLRVALPDNKKARIKEEQWCQTVAEKCKDVDVKTQMTTILGDLLKNVQNSGGNIGDYYVSQLTGGLNSSIGTARNYINKATRVVREFLAKVKGYLKKLLEDAVNALVKAVLHPNETGNALTPVTEFFNKALKDLGCQMEDLGERLIKWLTNVLMSFVNNIYRAAVCQVDQLVNGIISKLNQLLDELLSSILGPLQSILGIVAAPLNIIGDAINFILKLLGISCSGPDQTCNKFKQVCTNGEKKKRENDKDFLDDLLSDIDNLFGDTPSDYTQYVCDEAYTGNPLNITTVGFTGGIPLENTGDYEEDTKVPKIVYAIADIEVKEGDQAIFEVVRSGYLDQASSISYKTLADQGTAQSGVDYLPESSILGFQPFETSKTITIQTLVDSVTEKDEDFYISFSQNSPSKGSGITTLFVNTIAKCTISATDLTADYNPYSGKPVNPTKGIDDAFPPSSVDVPDNDGDGTPDDQDDLIDDGTGSLIPTYTVKANRSSCPEGEFIVYTITTTNVENGTILYYTLLGENITGDDIVGGDLVGSVVVSNNNANVTVGIAEDDVVEDAETLRFSLNGTGEFVDVLIIPASDQLVGDFDKGVGQSAETVFSPFEPPVIETGNIITDENGGIIEIPVSKPGDRWAEPPYVFIGGEGVGATATALLDRRGYITEIRIKSSGFGYKKNLAKDKGVRCVVDTFTIIRPGIGYTSVPDLYVNDELGIAEAIINDDGFVIGARVLDRTRTYESFPEIKIIGGGGYGAKLLPSLVCLGTEALSTIGSTKIGTGRYVDCP